MARLHDIPGWRMYALSSRRRGRSECEQHSFSVTREKLIGCPLFVRTAPWSAGIQENIPG